MASYRELLQQVKAEIEEIDSTGARELLDAARSGESVAGDGAQAPLFVDVRERDEWAEGFIPGAVHVPRGYLESRIEQAAPDRSRELVLYCAGGARSAFAVKSLQELGYENVVSLAGGFTDWKRNGHPIDLPRVLDDDKRRRYARHLMIPEIGEAGQLKLLDSRVLMIGAGGLGSPAGLYLAAAGVGTLGIVDDDRVDDSNLQRQVIHSTQEIGELKAESAKRRLQSINPDLEVVPYFERLSSENIDRILGDGWDVIVDGTDNFPTRYLLNDAAVWHDVPLVYGSIYRFEGQVSVFKPHAAGSAVGKAAGARPKSNGTFGAGGPCYRCLFPEPPPPELAPSCAEGGVLGVLPGIIGSLQANEALKLLLGAGEPLIGRLLLFDAAEGEFSEVTVRRNPNCPVCGDNPTITEYVDYVQFCAAPATAQGGPSAARA
jgi:molybdopterin/thiamine biosynthesis adenylyltransferase/rhodanese-related sulfurtransferase